MGVRSLLCCLLIAVTAAAPAAAAERAPRAAKEAAKARAVQHFDRAVKATFTLRSRRNRSWALVTGATVRDERLWAAWVRRSATGRWIVRVFRTRQFDPGSRVPCDLRPAFSEPAC